MKGNLQTQRSKLFFFFKKVVVFTSKQKIKNTQQPRSKNNTTPDDKTTRSIKKIKSWIKKSRFEQSKSTYQHTFPCSKT